MGNLRKAGTKMATELRAATYLHGRGIMRIKEPQDLNTYKAMVCGREQLVVLADDAGEAIIQATSIATHEDGWAEWRNKGYTLIKDANESEIKPGSWPYAPEMGSKSLRELTKSELVSFLYHNLQNPALHNITTFGKYTSCGVCDPKSKENQFMYVCDECEKED